MSVDYQYDGARLDKDDPVLRVDTVHKAFGGLVATDGVSLEVERGSITGLIGPNGAGKSTLFNLVAGYYEEDAGNVYIKQAVNDADSVTDNGVGADQSAKGTLTEDSKWVELTDMKPYEVAKNGLVRTFQTPRRLEGMTVREAMLIGPQNQRGESLLPLFTSPSTVTEQERMNLERAEAMLERFEIDHLATAPATELSGGQLKLVEMARALMVEPEIILLDEPVAGVNPTLAKKLARFVRELNDDGQTFLIIEHDMNFIMELADPIIVLDQGRILLEGSPADVRADDRVINAYLGGGV